MTDTILMTGATGFLGSELAARLIRTSQSKIYALVRAADEAEAYHRLRAAWCHDKELYQAIGTQILPLRGDFTKPGLGLSESDRQTLKDTVTLVLHAGAEIGFQKSKQELRSANYDGTKNVLSIAAHMRNLRRFVYVSTAYVAGRKSGIVMEEDPVGTAFSTLYEESKAEAESLVRGSSLPFSICRPGMIVGDAGSGWVRSFNTIYYILKLMLLGRMRILPVKPETPLNIVPGDYVADAVLRISFSEEAAGKTFHLTCPKSAAPRAGELAEYVRIWAGRNLSITLPKPVFLPLPALKRAGLLYNRKKEGRKKGYITNLLTLMPYFFGEQEFDRTNTDSICGPFSLNWRDYMDRLLTFACRKNFMRQTGQTVFEQAKVRRAGSRYPICYYDVTDGGIRKTTGPEVNRRIDQITGALWAWGIRKGNRVALTGINSVDYLALEQAIGLLGAVSVPIYYTTPAQETALLLACSGANWFFIGDKRMMDQIDDIETGARLVSFSSGQTVKHPRAMRWEQFLEKGTGPAPAQYPAPEDLATIRYTSGTTGEPKGAMFNYGQLAWMGEALTCLLPWKKRNRSMRYLSFLPLSHVVEGILAAYAPYYLLADVEFYYLNDFGALTEALPRVRPTVFFSVPRFYEKVWDQVTSNRLGKAWLAAKEGPGKRVTAWVLRRAVLKKAGLDRCGQLIVGSAPISETLLLHFRSLGIEIHNAYGQTEAPLITINRLGDNVIPTIGTPLPDTTITQEPDGELLVRGPQVMQGYYGLETGNLQDGVLRTGDLGTIHDNGHITLHGRKKDFIITAYGKNISIPKIEERLKDIPGVSEAVLIGENRPYCTALLWLEDEVPDLEAQIEQMNAGLSHPEQIRRYCVIPRPLSIQAGELTPNLKVKRGNVEVHLAQEIEEMYH
ncbi:MAG: AMP-binding protein [Acetatifactor muris]|nr:AMP-binding protein [Acetatifactor muris]